MLRRYTPGVICRFLGKKRKHEAALRIQTKFRGARDRQKAFAAKKQRKENMLRIAREKRRREFYSSASALLRDAERSAQTWVMLATSAIPKLSAYPPSA